jgi:23S rRNA pseudouridine2605 synthase
MGLKVSRLIRVGYGPFLLGDIPVRAVAEAPAATVANLKRRLKSRAQPAPAA